MSRIVNIGDFYRYQNSFSSVIENVEGYFGTTGESGGTGSGDVISYITLAKGEYAQPISIGTTGPVGLAVYPLTPDVGQYVYFNDSTPSGPHIVSSTGESSGTCYFTINPGMYGSGYNCSVRDTLTGPDIRQFEVAATGFSGEITVTLNTPFNIETGSYLYIEGGPVDFPGIEGNFGPSLITNVDYSVLTYVYIADTFTIHSNNYIPSIQKQIVTPGAVSTGSFSTGNFTARANAHAKRQFGNHPRRQ